MYFGIFPSSGPGVSGPWYLQLTVHLQQRDPCCAEKISRNRRKKPEMKNPAVLDNQAAMKTPASPLVQPAPPPHCAEKAPSKKDVWELVDMPPVTRPSADQ